MQFTTEPMMVVRYGVWEIDGRPVTNKDGEPAEYVQLLDLDADEVHRFSMLGIGRDRPKEMTWVRATCQARTANKGREDGSVTSRLKVRVVGLEKCSAPAASAAESASS